MSSALRTLAVLPVLAALIPAVARAEPDETTLPDDAVAHRDVTYATRATGPVKLDVFTPPGDGPFPVVVWIHGGAWKVGDKAAWPHMNWLVREGYAVVNVEYRFTQVAPFPAQLLDCTAAVDFIAKNAGEYRLDAGQIALTGESAGGHLASLVSMTRLQSATRPAVGGQVRAVIDLFGPSDMTTLAADPKLRENIDALVAGPAESRAQRLRAASPIESVGHGDPPFLILHGTKDPVVPFEQSQRLADALKKAGVPVELVPVQDAGHAGPAFWTPPLRAKMLDFLKRNLKP